jgi:putative inorganic carbon (HCO3(-)) transporter
MTDTFRPEFPERRALPARRLPQLDSIRTTNISTLLRHVAFLVLLVRSVCDPIFEMSSADLGGSTMGFGAVINALVITIVFLFVVLRPSAVPVAVFGMWAPFLLAAFGATLYAPQFTSAARLSLVFLSYWAMFALPFFMYRSPDDLPRFVLLVFASSIGPTLHALWDLRVGMFDSEFRLQSTFTHPNIYAFYLVLLLGLALYVRGSSAARWPSGVRGLITLYIPLLLVLLAFTKTRSAWVACAVVFLMYAVWVDRRFLLGLLAVPILLSAPTIVGERLADLSTGDEIENFKQLNDTNRLNSLAWREALWTSAIPPIMERPVLGHGLETFKPDTLEFFPLFTGGDGIDAHNMYLQFLYEMGSVGLLAFAWLVGSLLRWLKKGFRLDRNGTVVVFALVGAYLLESYSDNMQFYLAFNWYFMFSMGAFCTWIEHEKVRRVSSRPVVWQIVPRSAPR